MEIIMRIPTLVLLSFMALHLTAHAQEAPTLTPDQRPTLQQEGSKPAEALQSTPVTEDYICPMHKDVHGKKGGTCPICGMELVPAHADESSTTPSETPPTLEEKK